MTRMTRMTTMPKTWTEAKAGAVTAVQRRYL
jgi:hypothetical protein